MNGQMVKGEAMTSRTRPSQPREAPPAALGRLGAVFILVLLVAGCLALWLGVPAAALWLGSKLTDSFGWHMPVSLALAIPGMLALAAGLAWVNDLYLRVTGGRTVISRQVEIRRRGPLEPILIATLILAVAAFAVWFFLFAENPAVFA